MVQERERVDKQSQSTSVNQYKITNWASAQVEGGVGTVEGVQLASLDVVVCVCGVIRWDTKMEETESRCKVNNGDNRVSQAH